MLSRLLVNLCEQWFTTLLMKSHLLLKVMLFIYAINFALDFNFFYIGNWEFGFCDCMSAGISQSILSIQVFNFVNCNLLLLFIDAYACCCGPCDTFQLSKEMNYTTRANCLQFWFFPCCVPILRSEARKNDKIPGKCADDCCLGICA